MLSKKIIDSIVTDFGYDEDYGCFEVYVASKEEYQN